MILRSGVLPYVVYFLCGIATLLCGFLCLVYTFYLDVVSPRFLFKIRDVTNVYVTLAFICTDFVCSQYMMHDRDCSRALGYCRDISFLLRFLLSYALYTEQIKPSEYHSLWNDHNNFFEWNLGISVGFAAGLHVTRSFSDSLPDLFDWREVMENELLYMDFPFIRCCAFSLIFLHNLIWQTNSFVTFAFLAPFSYFSLARYTLCNGWQDRVQLYVRTLAIACLCSYLTESTLPFSVIILEMMFVDDYRIEAALINY